MASGRRTALIILLCAAVVFLGIEAIEAVIRSEALPGPLRFVALHKVGVVAFGALSVLSVIAAILLSQRWLVLLIGACIAAAAAALLFV